MSDLPPRSQRAEFRRRLEAKWIKTPRDRRLLARLDELDRQEADKMRGFTDMLREIQATEVGELPIEPDRLAARRLKARKAAEEQEPDQRDLFD